MNEDCKYTDIVSGETEFNMLVSQIPSTIDIDIILERYDAFLGFEDANPRVSSYPCCSVAASNSGRDMCKSTLSAKPSKMLQTFDIDTEDCNKRIPHKDDRDRFWRDLTDYVEDTPVGQECKEVCNNLEYLANEIYFDINSREEDRQAVAVIKLLRKYGIINVKDFIKISADDSATGDTHEDLYPVRCAPGEWQNEFKDKTDKLDDLGFDYEVKESKVEDFLLFGGYDDKNPKVDGRCLYITSLPDYYKPEQN